MTIEDEGIDSGSGGDAAGSPSTASEGTSDFGSGFGSDSDEFLVGLPESGTDEAPQAPAVEQPAPAVASPAPQPAVQPAPIPQGQPAAQAAPTAQSQSPLSLNSTAPLELLLQTLNENEPALVDAVAKQQFQLSDVEKEALETDAAAALPHILAKGYVKNLQSTVNVVKNLIPQMIQSEMVRHQSLVTVEQAFFTQYPQLDKITHGRDIVAVGQAMKARNPNMPPAELLHKIAAAVMGMHGIQRAAPQAPRGNGQVPFVPARSGPQTGATNLADISPFAGLGLDFEDGN